MDAQTFLAEFGHIVNAPGGMARLREMVLHLAATGKLIKESGNSEAPSLLRSIERQKGLHPERKKIIPKQSPISREQQNIPLHWAPCRLGDLALTITGGGTPAKNNPAYWGGDIPWVSVKDLKDLKYIDDAEDHITQEGLENSSSNLIEKGMVIVCTRMGLGKIAINRVPIAINQDLKALELPAEVNPDFFTIIYKTRKIKGTGTTVSGIRQEQLLALPAGLPPKEEQALIVAKVDELMALCDRLEEQHKERQNLQRALRQATLQAVTDAQSLREFQSAWTRMANIMWMICRKPEDVADLRKSILDLTVSGHFSSFDKSDQPATSLKERIIAAKNRGILAGTMVGKRHVKPVVLQETVLPPHWETITLDEAISTIDAGWSPACLPNARKDVAKWGILKTTSVQILKFLPHEHKELPVSLEPRPQYQIEVGDILITRAGPKNRVGICCVVDVAPARLMISDKIIRFHIVDDLINPHFVALCLSAGEPGRMVERLKSGMAESQMNISQDKLRSVTIPLPPQEEQIRILRKIDTLMQIIDNLERKMINFLKVAEQLATALISSIAGIARDQEQDDSMKAPETELVALLRLGATPNIKEQAPLATILARQHGEMSAKDLWQRFGGEIDVFYAQLKTEVANGWIREPAIAEMREVPQSQVSA